MNAHSTPFDAASRMSQAFAEVAAAVAIRNSRAFIDTPRSLLLDSIWDFLWARGICALDFRVRDGFWEAELTKGRGWVRVTDLLEGAAVANLDGEPHLCGQLS